MRPSRTSELSEPDARFSWQGQAQRTTGWFSHSVCLSTLHAAET